MKGICLIDMPCDESAQIVVLCILLDGTESATHGESNLRRGHFLNKPTPFLYNSTLHFSPMMYRDVCVFSCAIERLMSVVD